MPAMVSFHTRSIAGLRRSCSAALDLGEDLVEHVARGVEARLRDRQEALRRGAS